MSSDSSATLDRVAKLLSEVKEMLKNTTPEERRKFAAADIQRIRHEIDELLFGNKPEGGRSKKGKSRNTKKRSRK